jgi:hypothetical protein
MVGLPPGMQACERLAIAASAAVMPSATGHWAALVTRTAERS